MGGEEAAKEAWTVVEEWNHSGWVKETELGVLSCSVGVAVCAGRAPGGATRWSAEERLHFIGIEKGGSAADTSMKKVSAELEEASTRRELGSEATESSIEESSPLGHIPGREAGGPLVALSWLLSSSESSGSGAEKAGGVADVGEEAGRVAVGAN